MALWDKLKSDLDRAGKAAQSALDEGKLRLEILRVRQLADKAAQALGYAVYRARQAGQEIDSDSYARLSSTLAAHEAEANRLESQLSSVRDDRKTDTPADAASSDAGEAPGAHGSGAPGADQPASVDPAMGDSGHTPGTPPPASGGPGAPPPAGGAW